jgi:putative transcriptional regulator
MDASTNLTNQFLIAMPGMLDENFYQTVTYICEHSEQGAMGIVVNRPTNLHLNDILDQLDITDIDLVSGEEAIYIGGPVQPERGFVLHGNSHDWDSTLQVTPEISVTTSKDILESIAAGKGPEEHLVALGYAGWAGGQLEDEISANAWLSGPADSQIIFNTPADLRWKAAARLLGVDLDLISGDAGHG